MPAGWHQINYFIFLGHIFVTACTVGQKDNFSLRKIVFSTKKNYKISYKSKKIDKYIIFIKFKS